MKKTKIDKKEFNMYTIHKIPAKDYSKLRLLAAENETSINKTLLGLISEAVKDITLKKDRK